MVLMQKVDLWSDEPTILKGFLALDKVVWKTMQREVPAFADNPGVIKLSANSVCDRMDQQVIQPCVSAQVNSSYCLLRKYSL